MLLDCTRVSMRIPDREKTTATSVLSALKSPHNHRHSGPAHCQSGPTSNRSHQPVKRREYPAHPLARRPSPASGSGLPPRTKDARRLPSRPVHTPKPRVPVPDTDTDGPPAEWRPVSPFSPSDYKCARKSLQSPPSSESELSLSLRLPPASAPSPNLRKASRQIPSRRPTWLGAWATGWRIWAQQGPSP